MEFKYLNSIQNLCIFLWHQINRAAPLTTGNVNFLQHWYQSLWNPVASLLNRSVFQLTRIYIWTRAVSAGVPPKKSGCKNGFLLGTGQMRWINWNCLFLAPWGDFLVTSSSFTSQTNNWRCTDFWQSWNVIWWIHPARKMYTLRLTSTPPPRLPTWLSKVGQNSHYLFKITLKSMFPYFLADSQ